MANDPSKKPESTPPPRRVPAGTPHHDDRGMPHHAPEVPDGAEPPPSREPGPPPTIDTEAPDPGAVSVDPEGAHVGATEEQVGDRTGPGIGYDDVVKKQ